MTPFLIASSAPRTLLRELAVHLVADPSESGVSDGTAAIDVR